MWLDRKPSTTRPLFARWYGVLAQRAERGEVGKRRRALLAHASGRVLDLGVGTGESFEHLPPAVSELVALDPDPVMCIAGKWEPTPADSPDEDDLP